MGIFWGKSKTTREAEKLEREARQGTAELSQRLDSGEATKEERQAAQKICNHAHPHTSVRSKEDSNNGAVDPKSDTSVIGKVS